METKCTYKGHEIKVVTEKAPSDQCAYLALYRIDETLYHPTVYDHHPPKLFPDEQSAIAYGKESAEWIIDNR
jgi:hypothetical protein